jgi:hypothetical protein
MFCSAAVSGLSTHSFVWHLDANVLRSVGLDALKLCAEGNQRSHKSGSLADE